MARETGNERLVKNHDAYFLTEAAMAEANPQTILERGEAKNLPPALDHPGHRRQQRHA